MGVAASDAPANQAALYQQGAVQLLLHQLQWGRATALADGSLWALGCLVKGNVDIQTETEAQVKRTLSCVTPSVSCALRGMHPRLCL